MERFYCIKRETDKRNKDRRGLSLSYRSGDEQANLGMRLGYVYKNDLHYCLLASDIKQ